jgi:Uma2 family endonuclease
MSEQPWHLSADEFALLPSETLRLELMRGELVAMSPTRADHGIVAGNVFGLVGHYIVEHDLGVTYAATGFYIERNPDTVLAPDLTFIEATRVTMEDVAPWWVPKVPDLVVEISGRGDREPHIEEKARIWLDAGVRLVWVVYPPRREVVIHRPGRSPAVLAISDTISGEDVVPGFTCPVAQVFGLRSDSAT